jgi:hypothetical protein
MKIYRLTSALTGLLVLTSSLLPAAQYYSPSVISLKSCELEIQADRISQHDYGISFTGHVQFLYGLASVKTDSVVLVKKKDGSCQLIAKPSNGKTEE